MDRVDHDVGPELRPVLPQAPALVSEPTVVASMLQVEVRYGTRPLLVRVEISEAVPDDLVGFVALGQPGAGIPALNDAVGIQQVDRIVFYGVDHEPIHMIADRWVRHDGAPVRLQG